MHENVSLKTVIVEPECDFSGPTAAAAATTDAHRCTECGRHRFAAAHRPSRATIDSRTEIRDVSELGYADACSVERRGWRVIGIIESFGRFCSDWDYSDVLYRANMRAFEERFGGADYVEGRAGLLYDAEDLDNASTMISVFDALEDYPVLDEEVLSRLEDEEFWDTLTSCYDIPEDVEPETVGQWLQEHTSCYRADDLSQARIDDAVSHLPHRWRNRFEETADESDSASLADGCRYCGKRLVWHTYVSDVIAAEAAGQLPILPELALCR